MEPVSERIADKLFTRLQKLQAKYSAHSAVPFVRRAAAAGNTGASQHNAIILTSEQPSPVPELSAPGNPPAICWRKTFNIDCRVQPGEEVDTPLDQFRDYLAADVIKVVTDPAANWHNWDSLAINTEFGDLERIPAGDNSVGVRVPVHVYYRTDETSPYVVRG